MLTESTKSPIAALEVLPSYGSGTVVLRWVFATGCEKLGVNVYRAVNGAGYELISTQPVTTGFFVDQLRPNTRTETVSYRLVVEDLVTGAMAVAAQTGIYDHLLRAHHAIGTRLVAQEMHSLRRSGGMACWVMPGAGYLSPSALLDLCQRNNAGGSDMPGADQAQIWQSWVRLVNLSVTEARREDGTSKDVVVEVPARLPAWPEPKFGTMIVLPGSDDRYVVGEKITPYKYHSVVPYAYDVGLTLLGRSDPRYKIQMPAIVHDMARPSILPQA